jgi:hypothetical protein
MTSHLQRPMQKRARRITTGETRGVSTRLPESIVEARAGLIPSEKTDNCPPPGWLTAKELLAWHRGLPVSVSYATIAERLSDGRRRTR